MTEAEERAGRRALDMAIAMHERLDAHLKECNARYGQMVERGNERHASVIDQLSKIQAVLVWVAAFVAAGLFSIIGILLHNGGHL